MRFMTWLRKQRERDDPIGDLARDTLDVEGVHGRFPDLAALESFLASRSYDTRAAKRALRAACREAEREP
jgi:hypothetical protein